MAEDIAPGLRKNVEQSYRNSVAKDSELARIREKIDAGTATGKDLDAFAVRSGELLAQALHEHVSGDILPNGRMYYNIANRLLPPVLRQNYEDVADVSDAIQTIMNEQAGIGIKAQRPELNEDRVEGLVDLASEAEQYEDIRKELEGDVVNFSQSVATDSVKSNAEFQYQSGLSPKVERTAEPSCCPWCQKLENTYDYADIRGTGNEVWQRHRACRCVVEYVAAGKRQNAHTKQVSTMDREASAERIQRAQEAEKQDREQEQAEREERIQNAQEGDDESIIQNQIKEIEDTPFVTHRAVGAMARRFYVDEKKPLRGGEYYIAEQTHVTGVKVIAHGSGIRDVAELIETYKLANGDLTKVNDWFKVRGTAVVVDQDGNRSIREIHWYQAKNIGKVDFKFPSNPNQR